MSGKAWFVRAGVFKDVDVTLFTHVGSDLGVSYGQSSSNALISAIFKFKGQAAHAAGAPWRGKSALDAAMLMGMSWEFQREHMEIYQRSHYVIPDGGDQPNVVPPTASIWFYFRNLDYDRTMAMFEDAKKKAQARRDDDGHAGRHGHDARLGLERAFQPSGRRGHVREHQESRHAEVGRQGPVARQGHAARARGARDRAARRRSRSAPERRGDRDRNAPAAGRTTSAT